MASGIQVVYPDAVGSFQWPENQEAEYTARYVRPLMEDGARVYMDNVTARMMALVVDDRVLPLVVADGNPDDSNVCSVYSHYVNYARELLDMPGERPGKRLLRFFLAVLSPVLKAGRVGKVVYVNNWLFATNPCPVLTSEQIDRITAALTQHFPDHAIVFRSVNSYIYKNLYDVLRQKYRMVKSRRVYIIDPTSPTFFKNKNVKRDFKLLESGVYQIVDSGQLTEADVGRITELYRMLYLDKYTYINPQLNQNFFRLTLQQKIFEFKALRKNGRIDAFSCFYTTNGVMTGAFIGCDTAMPVESGLIRQAFALMMAAARAQGVLLHLSAGVGEFKVFRGAVPCIEYDAVYHDHLPLQRRLAWHCLVSAQGGWRRVAPLFQHNAKART